MTEPMTQQKDSSQDFTKAAHDALAGRLIASPAMSKEEAEAAKTVADALASLVTAEKIRGEVSDSKSNETIRRKRLEHFMNKLGISVSLLGIAGTISFGIDSLRTNIELNAKTAQLSGIDKREQEAKRATEVADQYRKAVELESKQASDQKEKAILEKTAAEGAAAEAESRVKVAEERIALLKKQDEAIREANAMRNEALEKLDVETKRKLAQLLGADNPVVVTSGFKLGRNPANADEEAEIVRLTPRVMDLFSPDGTRRGIAYDVLTNGKERTNPSLVAALLRTAGKKMEDYNAINPANSTQDEKSKLVLLRRGFENVVVTLRDMSRTVTKQKPESKEAIRDFAGSLLVLGGGVKEEAEKLLKWLDIPN